MDSPVTQGTSPSAFRVGLLLIDGFALLPYASVTEPLRVSNVLSGERRYELVNIAPDCSRVQSSGAAQVPACAGIGSDDQFDLIMVVAAGDPFAFDDEQTLAWLRHLARRGVALGGVSGGPVVLAAAGVMAGYRMTLHWEHAAGLAERYPELVIERSLYVLDRDRLTCSGGTAPLDLMHALIMRQHGAEHAREVSDWLQHTEVRPAGGAQRAGIVERYGVHHAPLLTAIEIMETHVADPLTLEDLARVSGVGTRQLTRLFDKQFRISPMAFYRHLRLAQARALLKQSGLEVSEIAAATGYANAAHFASQYRHRYGHPPSAERILQSRE